jgi:NADH-quinone oxidoreductase subunit L
VALALEERDDRIGGSHATHGSHDDHVDHGHGGSHSVHAASDDHGAHDDHGHGEHHPPRESGKLILVPIVILTFLAIVSGFTNATPFGESWENFKKHVEPRPEAVLEEEAAAAHDDATAGLLRVSDAVAADEGGEEGGEESHAGCGYEEPADGSRCFFPAVSHAEFKWSKAALSLIIVGAGLLSSWLVCVALYSKRDRRLVGLTERSRVARAGYRFLANKYYLDALYEGVIVRGIAHPIARGFNWVNQNLIDGVVNAAGWAGRKFGGLVYRNIDQRVVDGAVNGSGAAATGSGSALRPVQSGKVNQYGALLFGAAAVGAVVLVIVNV